MGLIDCNAGEGIGTDDREYPALRGHLSGQTPVDNVMNDLESVNFIQSKNLRCMIRHQNPLIGKLSLKAVIAVVRL